jgi:hypothetical protein
MSCRGQERTVGNSVLQTLVRGWEGGWAEWLGGVPGWRANAVILVRNIFQCFYTVFDTV